MSGINPITMNSTSSVANSSSKQNIIGTSFKEILTNIDKNFINIEQQVNFAVRNDKLSPAQLLALQSGVLRSSLELDITSRLIEKITSGIKQTMNSQI
ncbi:MAG: hypothetical protein N2746_12080 [Deltaproteobacteria bacterium]|nr:hypothetical protein [Deltaproteobacteria bacterium]